VAACALVALPLAAAWALTQTRAVDSIGVSPTTFSIGTGGHSELRLGIAGTVYLPVARGPFGLVASVDGPAAVSPDTSGRERDLASLVSPEMLQLYAGIFHDPQQAVHGYIDLVVDEAVRTFALAELVLTSAGTCTVLVLRRVLPSRAARSRPRWRIAAVVATTTVASTVLAMLIVMGADDERPDQGVYALPALDGTAASGATTSSPLLRLLLGDAIPKVEKLIDRQEQGSAAYVAHAEAGLAAQASAMTGPRTHELAVLMQSDMHCNESMIRLQTRVAQALRDSYGADVPAVMAVTGDLTTNGTAAERSCVDSERAVVGKAPVLAVTGNHESDLSAKQMASSGMHVLDGDTVSENGVSALGDGDPERTELFGDTYLRGQETEADMGKRLRAKATVDHPALVLVHEAYAAAGFLGVDDMREFLDERGSATTPHDDGVPDVPASAVLYGHWHRSVEPRVVWNSDGTWTLVMELDTSGGAVATPTIGHFSTPWTSPQQEASFPVLFLDDDTGLVTGYQLYSFATDGTATVHDRVEVGNPEALDALRDAATTP
jgi:hypothetical protein